mmetsp:Transcript_16368/g.25306  ORF Transcript_16368/g.25306 Transcript_16368/m.25306 type:complete len:87 (-) Transcript_16368:266-526(-)
MSDHEFSTYSKYKFVGQTSGLSLAVIYPALVILFMQRRYHPEYYGPMFRSTFLVTAGVSCLMGWSKIQQTGHLNLMQGKYFKGYSD